jgi:hypothetical protein
VWLTLAALAAAGCYDDQCPSGTHLLGVGCVPDVSDLSASRGVDLGMCPRGIPTGSCPLGGYVCAVPPPVSTVCTCVTPEFVWRCCSAASCGDGGVVDGGRD